MNMVQLFIDHNAVCAMIGPDAQDGIAGFGVNVAEALRRLAASIDAQNYHVSGLDRVPLPPGPRKDRPWLVK
jgi:hypothetical protein